MGRNQALIETNNSPSQPPTRKTLTEAMTNQINIQLHFTTKATAKSITLLKMLTAETNFKLALSFNASYHFFKISNLKLFTAQDN